MPRKNKLLEMTPEDMPETHPFFYGRVETPLLIKVERRRETAGHTVAHMLKRMCELYIKEEKNK